MSGLITAPAKVTPPMTVVVIPAGTVAAVIVVDALETVVTDPPGQKRWKLVTHSCEFTKILF